MVIMMPPLAFLPLLLLPITTNCFAPSKVSLVKRRTGGDGLRELHVTSEGDGSDPLSKSSLTAKTERNKSDIDIGWQHWANDYGIFSPKLEVRSLRKEDRGKGGVFAKESISPLEVIARIPRDLILAACDASPRALSAAAEANDFSWATDLTAVAISNLHPTAEEGTSKFTNGKQLWIRSWKEGGWATNSEDLGPPDVSWGSTSVTGSLMSTGSDNDRNIYAKFRLPCHPMVHHASRGLAMQTGVSEAAALEALLLRGCVFRSMRDALLVLVDTPTDRKGSLRERRSWDVADVLSKVLSRATTLQFDDDDAPTHVVVPLHERLAQCDSSSSENSKLIVGDSEVLLVATSNIEAGDAITRDYNIAPSLDGDTSTGPLRLLLQFGLPASAW